MSLAIIILFIIVGFAIFQYLAYVAGAIIYIFGFLALINWPLSYIGWDFVDPMWALAVAIYTLIGYCIILFCFAFLGITYVDGTFRK